MPEIYTDKDYSDRLVAFLDILGFHRLISQDKSSALVSINTIDGHLQHILQVLHDEHGEAFSTRLFSDCMCISCANTDENLFYIIFELAFIQYYFSRDGIFLRGALSRGDHFENARMIFSKGLVNAYNLEEIAIYPRILIDGELVARIIADHRSYDPLGTPGRTRDFVIQSPDKHYSVDYLHLVQQESLDPIEELERHKHSIETTVERNSLDNRIVGKCRWLADYHNCKVTEVVNPDDYEEPDLSENLRSTAIDVARIFPYFTKI